MLHESSSPQNFENNGKFTFGQGHDDIVNPTPLPYEKLFFSRSFKEEEEDEFLVRKNHADAGDVLAQYEVGRYYEDGIGVPQSYAMAFHYYESAANQGHSMSQYKLGRLYEDGLGTEQSYEHALWRYEGAANQGIVEALVSIGKLYEEGRGVKKSIAKALEYYCRGIDQDNPMAWALLANLYQKGLGVEQSQEKAEWCYQKRFQYHKRMAEQGDVDAQFALGLDYQNGWGVEQSFRFAFDCFEWASEKNCIRAFIFLGDYCAQGLGVKKSAEWAIYHYEVAARQGNPLAQALLGPYLLRVHKKEREAIDYLRPVVEWKLCSQELVAECECSLGECYEKGIGVASSVQTALSYYLSSAEHGNKQAMLRLRQASLRGELGLEKTSFISKEESMFPYQLEGLCGHKVRCRLKSDEERKFDYYFQHAKKGDPIAQYELGQCYRFGIWTAQSDEKAIKYYKLAADQRYPDACEIIGIFYNQGLMGLTQSHEEAFKYLKTAADQGNQMSQYNVGLFYEKGLVVDQSDEIAARYYQLSANQGNAYGRFAMGRFFSDGRGGVEQSNEEAFKYYLLAAEQGIIEACFWVGSFYMQGLGSVKQSYEIAVEYFKLSADQGFVPSLFNMGLFFEKGLGVEQSYEKAAKYYQFAANEGDVKACYKVALFYQQGLGGLELSQEESLKYFKIAAEKGHTGAQRYIERN